MRTFYRVLAILAVAFGLCLGLAPLAPAQADTSVACQRYQYLHDQPLKFLSNNAMYAWGRQMAFEQCATNVAAANDIPVRQFTGDQLYAPRPGKPCEQVAHQLQGDQPPSESLQAECVADWVDYVGFYRSRAEPKACFDGDKQNQLKYATGVCRPDQSAVAEESDDDYSLTGSLGLLAAVTLVFALWWFFGRGSLPPGYHPQG
jgi:hypothetical protein